MQIKTADIQPGDNLIFKRAKGDYVGLFFSLLLKLFNPDWDMWGWHMAVVVWPAIRPRLDNPGGDLAVLPPEPSRQYGRI